MTILVHIIYGYKGLPSYPLPPFGSIVISDRLDANWVASIFDGFDYDSVCTGMRQFMSSQACWKIITRLPTGHSSVQSTHESRPKDYERGLSRCPQS